MFEGKWKVIIYVESNIEKNPQILNVDDQQGRYDSSYKVADGIVILEGEWEVNSCGELHSQLLKRCDNTHPDKCLILCNGRRQ